MSRTRTVAGVVLAVALLVVIAPRDDRPDSNGDRRRGSTDRTVGAGMRIVKWLGVVLAAAMVVAVFGVGFLIMADGQIDGEDSEMSLFGTGLALVALGFTLTFRAFDWIRELRHEGRSRR